MKAWIAGLLALVLATAAHAEGLGPKPSGGSSGGITIGQPVTGGTPSTLLYNDASGNIANSATIPFIVTNTGLTTTSPGWYAQITGDAFPRVRVGLNASDVASVAFGGGAGARDLFLERAGAASLRLGTADAAAPVAQTLSVQNVVAGTSNTAGANLTINGSQGTGTGAGGSVIFQVAPAGSTGSAQNALATALTISSAGTTTLAPQVNASALTISSYSLTGTDTHNLLNLAGTWNVGTTVVTAVKLNMTDTASGAASLLIDAGVGGGSYVSQFNVSKVGAVTAFGGYTGTGYDALSSSQIGSSFGAGAQGVYIASNYAFAWSSNASGSNIFSGTKDLILARDAAGILAQRNGVNAQAQRWYKTYTDASNYLRAVVDTTQGNWVTIGTQGAGTGSAGLPLYIDVPTGQSINFSHNSTGTVNWQVSSAGHFLAGTDNTYDIGSTSLRVRDAYIGRNPFFNGLTTDATKTDTTLCVDSTTGQVYKGSGTLGICLGTSSARYKHDIEPLSDSCQQIAALEPKNYRYNAGYGDDGAREQYGFIAEDVDQVLPGVVGKDAKGRPNTVDIVALIPIIVNCLKDMRHAG